MLGFFSNSMGLGSMESQKLNNCRGWPDRNQRQERNRRMYIRVFLGSLNKGLSTVESACSSFSKRRTRKEGFAGIFGKLVITDEKITGRIDTIELFNKDEGKRIYKICTKNLHILHI